MTTCSNDLSGKAPTLIKSDTRPLLLGYISAADRSTEHEIAQHTVDLAAYADSAGYVLGTVFVQSTDWTSDAFDALMSEGARIGAEAVLLAGPEPKLLQCAWTHQAAVPELIAV